MGRLFALLLLIAAFPASAQRAEPEWRTAREEPVRVRVGAFEPDPLMLEAGRPTRLIFYNGGRTRLSVDAGRFFANSYVRTGDAEIIEGGGFVLAPGQRIEISLVPTEGRYRLRSGSWVRRLFGMSSLIIVAPPEQRSAGRSVD